MLCETKDEMSDYMPFAMTPVVYNFSLNHKGSAATLLTGEDALMPGGYYALHIPLLVKQSPELLPDIRRAEIHLAKNQKTAFKYSGSIPFVVATSYLTHKPIEKVLKQTQNFGYHDNLYFSQGKKLFKFLFSFARRALIFKVNPLRGKGL